MIVVAYATFDGTVCALFSPCPRVKQRSCSATVIATLITHNLAIGVITGVVTATVLFARRVAHLVSMDRTLELDPMTVSKRCATPSMVKCFSRSSNDLVYQFEYSNDPDFVIIDLTGAHVWDASTVASLDAVVTKYEKRGKSIRILGLMKRVRNSMID